MSDRAAFLARADDALNTAEDWLRHRGDYEGDDVRADITQVAIGWAALGQALVQRAMLADDGPAESRGAFVVIDDDADRAARE